jgi:hypothetical protein
MALFHIDYEEYANDEDLHVCHTHVCAKTHKFESSLARHICTHSGTTCIYKCKSCAKEFKTHNDFNLSIVKFAYMYVASGDPRFFSVWGWGSASVQNENKDI